ncbi:WD repeat-containing protein 11 [Takifugu rubripes]|uniref:WD repeat-containing protein 11 n=1 Tax=Takifugu rubripes TaxID=31033 RepID=A0A674PLR5_TAKRU|nr:WD repeat-containing protein 11 [Takifugu rubripes]|eukprot:XP_003963749.1 PREDICTED: LOW QUALITY PROTEIN: WD repeat-containing protein 11 [Takifugu rubripes]
MIPYTVNIKLAARTLTGTLNLQNKSAVDWGWQGLIAQGCHSSILIIDPKTAQTIQVLEKHKSNVVKVKWSRENYYHNLSSPYCLRLASGDASGKIIVWDVVSGTAHCEIQEHSKPIQDLEWLWNQDASRDLLLAIHPPNYIVLWNGDTGTKLWKKSYAENILSFSFDPFDPSNMALLTSEGIVFITDFTHSKPPSSAGKKVYIASPHASPAHTKPAPAAAPAPTGAKKALNKVKVLITNEKPTAEAVTLNDCLQLSYLPSKRNHMLLLYPREILILDLELSQTVGVVAIERSGVPFIQVSPCAQRDALYCLHENGCITLRVCRSTTNPEEGSDPEQSAHELVYDLRSQSDAIRVTKTVRPYRMVICPVNENSAALMVGDGRVMLWELKAHSSRAATIPGSGLSPLYSPVSFCGAPLGPNQKKIQDLSLNSMIGPTLIAGEIPPLSSNQQEIQLKFLLSGLLSGLPLPPFAIRMCPPLTTKNINHYQPLLSVGTSNGSVLVYNLTSGLLYKELSVHSCEVRGIEWVSLTSFLSFATSAPNNMGLVRNELQHVNLPTGRCFAFRGERGNDEPPIEMIKVSHLKQYLVVVFRDKPLELWDIRTGTLLREMAKNFPTVTALEWSPSHNLKSLKKKQMAAREAMARQTVSDAEQSSVESSVISLLQDAESKSETSQAISAREHFVFTDTDGQVYHITVEGNTVKDGARIPPDGSMGSITCIAWKGDTLVLGDIDGNLNFWDLKARLSRGIPTHRGWVKKIRFAPGKGNQKLLVMYADGAEVWDTKDVQMVSSMRVGRNMNYRVLDIDWCTSDKVVLASDDGCVRVLEMAMKSASYRMDEQDLTDPVWCPYLLVPRAALTLKAFLLLQPWSGTFTMDISQIDYNEKEEIKGLIQEQLNSLSNDMKSVLQDPELSLLQRCLLVSRLFGDDSDLHFWTVASHYLQSFAHTRQLSVATVDGQVQCEGTQSSPHNHLDICHDVLCESSYFQKFQLDRVHLQEAKRSSYEHTKKCADQLLLLGQTDRAVQLLLETSADNPSYYCDSLKACLVTTITSSGPSQSTIKLVATNMIANGKLAEGVQLLCLIDKAADACRYLQTYGEWNRAAWLAKVRLSPAESSDVLKRWAEHLCSQQVNQKSKAILVLLSLGCFYKVGEMLHSMRQFDRTALFIEACLKYGLMEANDTSNKLIEAAFLDYARLLRSLGLREGAALWASRAGTAGEQLMEELFQGEGGSPETIFGKEQVEFVQESTE